MDSLKLFLKENRIKKENVFYGASSSLRDEAGNTVLWEIRPIGTDEDERIREDCMREAKGRGVRVDYNLYMKKLLAASVVYPPLYNAQLQDSYGVVTPEELIVKMVDIPGEYQELVRFVQKLNGFDTTIGEKVERAKN